MPFNILLSEFPKKISISNKDYEINTDFRVYIKIFEINANDEYTNTQKIAKIIKEVFGGRRLPPSLKDTLKAIAEFWSMTEVKEDTSTKNKENISNRIIDFYEDSGMIYSAFLGQYGVNLKNIDYMHWWEFLELFRNLCGEHKILEAMKVRSCNLSKIKNKQERSRMRELKEIYKLKDLRTQEEQDNDIANMFS